MSGVEVACPQCRAGEEHCHGTLVHHRDGTIECTDVTCASDDAAHPLVVACDDAGLTCRCAGGT